MRIIKFLDGVTADTTSATYTIDVDMFPEMRVQVDVGTAATVTVQGKFDGLENWVTISDGTITADDAYIQATLPMMRVVSTGVSGALYVYGVLPLQRVHV